MKNVPHRTIVVAMLLLASPALAAGIEWRDWSPQLFDEAKRSNRFVLLDMDARWCHWCHVMDEETWSNDRVAEVVNAHYIAVRVDQDANPDLSIRYEDWGWPATIVFAADGTEIVKRRGFMPPVNMLSMLQAIVEDPSPGPSVFAAPDVEPASGATLSASARERILDNYDAVYDETHGGWGSVHKFIHEHSLDLALDRARRDDAVATRRARQTLDAAMALIDPVWGGVYQYSDQVDWRSPHYEKLMSFQAQYLRQYSEAWLMFGDEAYLEAARKIAHYLVTFLRDESGAFHASQRADPESGMDGDEFYALDAEARQALAPPPIDRRLFARENGWAIVGLVALHDATGERVWLDHAVDAARWIMDNRRLDDGGFAHGENDRGGPYLGDNLAMGRAFLALHASTGDRHWLDEATSVLRFIAGHFRDEENGGYFTSARSAADVGVFTTPSKQVEENIDLARLGNLAAHYAGDVALRDIALHAMSYLGSEAVTGMRRFLAGIVLAEREITRDPVHIAIVGAKHDPEAAALFTAAKRYPAGYRRLEWWDRSEGALPNPDIEYPVLERAAAFACANRTCSLPVFLPDDLSAAVERTVRADEAS